MRLEKEIQNHLTFLYGTQESQYLWNKLQDRLDRFRRENPHSHNKIEARKLLSEQDAILITYGDQVRERDRPPLQTLADFLQAYLGDCLSGVHILPFFPYSSDDGFSVVDYCKVNPDLGDWADIASLDKNFRLMFDAVINHISTQSEWFQGFLRDDPRYRDYFITVDGNPDLSGVVRPRALPLLTEFRTASGSRKVWTTFSDDQVDLNYHDPDLLLEIIDILLFYVSHGAEFIRLDAIAYLWKEIGTTCIHLPQTHRVVQLIRSVLDEVAPQVMLITETNVPHQDNISYFGDGFNEAQLVYNFALPPLALHTLHTGDARALSGWATGLHLPTQQTTFFNFLASHDGVGINPARGILSEIEIEALIQQVQTHGGLVSYKQNADGTQSPYELNVNYFDALSNPNSGESAEIQIDRFICAHAIMFSLVGVPGIYFHSMFGSHGWPEGVAQTGRNRTINRQKLWRSAIEGELNDPQTLRSRIYHRLAHLLRLRAAQPAFDPHGDQRVVELDQAVFAVLRTSSGNGERVLCLHNVSGRNRRIALNITAFEGDTALDLITEHLYSENQASFDLRPYQVAWLKLAG